MANEPLESIKFPGIANTFTVPPVDNTLAVQGAAADAKKVGDEISDLKADINKAYIDLFDMRGNLRPSNFELGNIRMSADGWTYLDSNQRLRTKEGVAYHLTPGTVVGLTDYTDAQYYIGWKKGDGTYGLKGWVTHDETITEEGDYVFLVVNKTEKAQSSIYALYDLLKVDVADSVENQIKETRDYAENRLDTLELAMNGKEYIPEAFESGTYDNAGDPINSAKYIRCCMFNVENPTLIKCDADWTFKVYVYDSNGTTLLYQSNFVDSDGAFLLSAGDYAKITLRKSDNSYITQAASEHVYFDLEYMDDLQSDMLRVNKAFASINMCLGVVGNDGNISHINGWVCTKDIVHFDRKIMVHADAGYMYNLTYYTSDGSYLGVENVTQNDIIVPANTYFRLQIRKVTYETATRSAFEYMKHVTITAYELDEKPLHEWWFYKFGIAHGGADGFAPFNTLPSFKYAIDTLEQKMMETDIRFTADGIPVLMHDESINSVALNADGTELSETVKIADITYQQALTYNFCRGYYPAYDGTKICTFEELLRLCRDTGVYVDFDPKIDLDTTKAQTIVDMLKKYQMVDRAMINTVSITRYRSLWDKLEYPLLAYNLLYIPAEGADATVAQLKKVDKNKNIIVALYFSELEKTEECQKFIDAGFRICNASVVSDATILTFPVFVEMSCSHGDMQDILRRAALT